MSRKLRMGVIGVGMGKNHAKAFQTHPGAELVALCDMDKDRLNAVAGELNCPLRFTDVKAMLRDAKLDAASVATPNKFRAPVTIAALQAGLHVLCEKPMAMNAKEAAKMNAAARKARKNLMINFSYRFSDMSYALKHQVDAGVIGDIYYGRTVWHRRRSGIIMGGKSSFVTKEMSGGGPLIDLGVHRLDLALWLMGYPEPVAVSGSTYDVFARQVAEKRGRPITVEDLACGIVKFKNGATLIIEASWALNIREQEHMVTMLCGTKGGLVQKNVDGGYKFTAEVYTEEDGHLFTKTLDWSMVSTPSPYHEFINSIVEKRLPLATGEHGLKVMKILDGIYKSAETGKEVRYS